MIGDSLAKFVAEATDIHEIQHSYGNLIFVGVFFLALIIAVIWWLKRSV